MLVCGAICACILLTTCGGSGKRAVVQGLRAPEASFSPGSSQDNKTSPEGLDYRESISLDEALVELGGMECPEGVEEALFEELKGALEEALHQQWGASTSRSGVSSELAGAPGLETDSPRGSDKFVSTPPSGEANRVNDLQIADNGDGTYTLSWHYRNLGDYDQDGTVAVEDIIPLAEHFGETYEHEDVNCIQAVIDGSSNGRIGIEDITPIAMNFAASVHHYAVEGAPEEAGAYEPVSEIAQDAGTGEGRLEYSVIIESPAALWHRVVPYDSEGAPGEPSNAVLRPSNEPIIYEVSPTEGYQHEERTFSATVTGAEPLTYAWDFGGGATPDTSSESSPTVTLADAGEYAASLTVTNAYGEAVWPFTLTVSERDTWAHTWGGGGYEEATALALDSQGNVYLAGYTLSFGAGSLDILLLKYTPEGDLVFAKTWGSEGADADEDEAVSISIDTADNVYVASETDSFGAGMSDSLLLKYDTDGNLIWARTWGGDWIEHVSGLGTDNEGNVYVGGYRAVAAFASWDIFVLKYSPAGELQHTIGWDSGLMDEAADMAVDAEGNCYVAGKVYDIAASGNKALVVSFDGNGTLRWARAWGTDGKDDKVEGVALGQDGVLHCIGRSKHTGYGSPLLLTYDNTGELQQSLVIDLGRSATGRDIAVDERGRLHVSGTIASLAGESGDALLLICDSAGEVQFASCWCAEEDNYEGAKAVVTDKENNCYLAGYAVHNSGIWQALDGTANRVVGLLSSVEGVTLSPVGTEDTPEGTETLPEGIEDTGGGGYYGFDLLVLKNCPR